MLQKPRENRGFLVFCVSLCHPKSGCIYVSDVGGHVELGGHFMEQLKAKQVEHAKPGDKLSDGGGLRLDVDKSGNRSWVFRFKSPITGKERYMGLGPAGDVKLTDARGAAADARAL